MSEKLTKTFKVKIFREDIGFSVGHISIHNCSVEAFHGHSYFLSVEFEGTLDENYVLVDFRIIKKIIKDICKSLDNRTLIPTKHPLIKIYHNNEVIRITIKDKYLELPNSDVVCLEIPNTSSEMLALYLHNEIANKLDASAKRRIRKIGVEVIESAGQSAIFEGVL